MHAQALYRYEDVLVLDASQYKWQAVEQEVDTEIDTAAVDMSIEEQTAETHTNRISEGSSPDEQEVLCTTATPAVDTRIGEDPSSWPDIARVPEARRSAGVTEDDIAHPISPPQQFWGETDIYVCYC